MPQVPVPDYDEFPKLRKLEGDLTDRTDLYVRGKKIENKLKEINEPLFRAIRSVLPMDVKSFQFPFESDSYLIIPMQQDARKNFKREKLLNATFACPHCKERITLPAKVLDKAYERGKLPRPTVSVKLIGGGDGSGNGSDDE